MASTTRSGAVYGIGVYGAVRYGETSVTYVPDGVFATGNSDSGVIIIGDAVSVVVGVSTTAAVGGVGVVGVAVTSVVGVEATAVVGDNVTFKLDCKFDVDGVQANGAVGDVVIVGEANVVPIGVFTTGVAGDIFIVGDAAVGIVGVEATAVLGEASQRTVNRVPVDGIEVVGAVGDIVVVAKANTVAFGSTAFGFVGGVTIRAASSVTIAGVVVVASVGDNVTFKLDCEFDVAGVVGAATVDFLVVATTSFDYEAVRDLYERYRTVFVERGTTGAERTVIVEAVPRSVYTESMLDRLVYVDSQSRMIYIESKPIREIAVN